MITKIKDENGVEHEIQGAGYKYDENTKNITIGSDTVANGYNQFVFGHLNVPEADKIEIVGNGFIGNSLTIGDEIKINPAADTVVYYAGKRLAECNSYFSDTYVIINSYPANKSENDIIGIYISFQPYIPNMISNIWVEFDDGLYSPSNSSNSGGFYEGKSYSGDSVYKANNLIKTSLPKVSERKIQRNIRTLDIYGNQHNAGNISSDKNIICNGITLRDSDEEVTLTPSMLKTLIALAEATENKE